MPSALKKKALVDGGKFLREAFYQEQKVLQTRLELASTSVTHDGKMGDVTENHFLEQLRAYLPKRYTADSAIVIDSKGATSEQIDIVIYDRQYTPTLLDQQQHKYVPAEAVYAVLEVKPEINKSYLNYAGKKVASVRALHRTSIPIPHAGGEFPKKELFTITGGLVAARAGWKEGLEKSFSANYRKLAGDAKLDCVLALNSKSFDVFNKDGSETFSPGKNALVFFLFRLLQRLQSLGTVPAIDWNAYAAQLAEK